ncbi:MAG: RNA-binding protein [Lachnospiraceae bacterium]
MTGNMTKEEQILCRHLLELAENCYNWSAPVFSNFLSLNEQSLFESMKEQLPPIQVKMEGGHELAERKMIVFLPTGTAYEVAAPVAFLKIAPVNAKFADSLTHRDFLGAVLNLGMEREKIGDILVEENEAVLICHEEMANFIVEHLEKIKHTNVTCRVISREEFHYTPKVKEIRGTVASLRLDAILSLAFGHSRNKMSDYIKGEKVYINGKLKTSNSVMLKEGDVVSVRGVGKFAFQEIGNTTKKDRIFITIHVYA